MNLNIMGCKFKSKLSNKTFYVKSIMVSESGTMYLKDKDGNSFNYNECLRLDFCEEEEEEEVG